MFDCDVVFDASVDCSLTEVGLGLFYGVGSADFVGEMDKICCFL